jgi:LysM repeat protein
MPQIQTKTQPNTRTQPTATTTPPGGRTAENLKNALIGFFRNLYNTLTSSASFRQQFTASISQSRGQPTGVAPLFAPPAQKRTDVFTPPQQLKTFYSTPTVSPQVQQEIERKKEARRLESQLAGKKIDFSKINIQQSQTLTAPTPESTPAFLPQAKRQQTTLTDQTSKTSSQMSSKTATSKSGITSATTSTISTDMARGLSTGTSFGVSSSPNLGFNLFQSPFAQDIQNLITPPPSTTQTTTNAPQGADIQVFRDPLGGSTQFFGYTIKPGDTLTKIAKTFGVSIEDILRLNKDKTDAVKNVPGRPFGDIIIAGKEIRIPVIEKELKQPPLLGQKFSSVDEINQKAKENLQTPQATIDENKLNQLILEKTGVDLSRIDATINRLNQLNDPNFYVSQYNQLLEKTGISKDIQALADIRSIMERTKQDVLEEAAKVGGLVTESQIAEVVNFRHGILKAQYQALADAIEAKERMIDNIMKYTAMDRKTIADLLESQLNLERWKVELAMNAVKWDFNTQKELRNTNLKKLENYADAGELHTASPDTLYHFVDPESPLYAGITVDELRFYIRMSQEKARQRELDEIRTKQLIQNTLEEMQVRRAKEARAWAKEARERELHPLRKRRLEKLIEKGEEGGDTLNPDEY